MSVYIKHTIENGNRWHQQWFNSTHPREYVFLEVLNKLNGQPVNILEIGTTYDKDDPNAIQGAGFSTFYFADYVNRFGGSLTTVDINSQNLEDCKIMLEDFIKAGTNIKFVCGDGFNWISNNNEYDLVYLDGPNDEVFTYESYKKINRTKTHILCDDANLGRDSKAWRLRGHYIDYILYKCGPTHEMIFYPKVEGNEKTFKIGNLELEYIRENSNNAWRNERSIELALAKWFAEKHAPVIELGATCYQYSFFNNWDVIDPYDNGYPCIRADILDYDYSNKCLVSISTIEHCGVDEGYNQPIVKDLAIKGLEKIVKQSKEYLITFPVGANRELEDYLRNQDEIKYTFMVRKNSRGETNNWEQKQDNNLFYENYLHFDYNLGYYGSAFVVCIIHSQNALC